MADADMSESPNFPKIAFEAPYFPDHTIPRGCLPADARAQACWYFYVIAQEAKENVGNSIDDQVILEGELWLDTHYVQQKRTVCTIYGFGDPAEMDKFWEFVRSEAAACGLPAPDGKYVHAAPLVH